MTEIKCGDTFSMSGFFPNSWPAGTWSARAKLIGPDGTTTVLGATMTAPSGNETRFKLALYLSAAATALLKPGIHKMQVELTNSAATPDPFVVSDEVANVKVKKDYVV